MVECVSDPGFEPYEYAEHTGERERERESLARLVRLEPDLTRWSGLCMLSVCALRQERGNCLVRGWRETSLERLACCIYQPLLLNFPNERVIIFFY